MKGLKPGQPILTVSHLKRKFGDRTILEDVSFSLQPGDRVGVLGVNGAGKSSLMRIVAGHDPDFGGVCAPAKGVSVGYVPQEPILDPDKTVRENVELAVAETRAYIAHYEEILKRWEDPEVLESEEKTNALLEEQGEVQDILEHRDAMDPSKLDAKIEMAMAALRLPPGDKQTAQLSGGEKRRVSLCKELLAQPDLLILDEPTNHLDADTITWLENYLANYSGTYMLVTHDRYFLDRVANRMIEVTHGVVKTYSGNYSSFLEAKEIQEDIQDRTDANLKKAVARELQWIRSTPRRGAPSRGRELQPTTSSSKLPRRSFRPRKWICGSPSDRGSAAKWFRCVGSPRHTTARRSLRSSIGTYPPAQSWASPARMAWARPR